MKRFNIICLLICFFCVSIHATEKDKGNKIYLPEEGDIAIGIDARPFVNFVGNMFNNTVSQSLDRNDIGGEPLTQPIFSGAPLFPMVSITGKYMLTDQLGLRANIGFIVKRDNVGTYVVDDAAVALDPLSEAKVIDRNIHKLSGASFALGAEYRIGEKRVQGVFSGSLLYALATETTSYSYGNAITDLNQKPSIGGVYDVNNFRILEEFGATPIHQFGLVCGVGVEWFVAPKFSIGAEVNLSLLYAVNPQTYSVKERYNIGIDDYELRTDLETPKNHHFVFGTENIGANLFFNFFF